MNPHDTNGAELTPWDEPAAPFPPIRLIVSLAVLAGALIGFAIGRFA